MSKKVPATLENEQKERLILLGIWTIKRLTPFKIVKNERCQKVLWAWNDFRFGSSKLLYYVDFEIAFFEGKGRGGGILQQKWRTVDFQVFAFLKLKIFFALREFDIRRFSSLCGKLKIVTRYFYRHLPMFGHGKSGCKVSWIWSNLVRSRLAQNFHGPHKEGRMKRA